MSDQYQCLQQNPVIQRLAPALALAECDGRPDTEVYKTALGFAIQPRWQDARPTGRGHIGAGRIVDGGALQKWRLRRVVEHVDRNLSAKITLAELASVAGLSRMHFAARFRAATGLRPHEYLLRRRVRCAQDLLRNSSATIVEVALGVGFQTQAHFTTVFKRFAGETPYRWRQLQAVDPMDDQ
jgi:AraC family transcriptional regulator